ncbi:MAG: M28 family peptidase [Schleiferiaceae bacterium]|nr:M28 family peptidase [Schleiferiaceae bacterium]
MKTRLIKSNFLVFILWAAQSAFAQSNFVVTSNAAGAVLHGEFDPTTYALGSTATPRAISAAIYEDLNADSLKAYILRLASFENRNTGSDTASSTRGIGAARRWVYQSFQRFSTQQNSRLLPSYFQFDQGICGMAQHRNILAVLPGTDTANHQIILIEGHMDSRCDSPCDTACLAQGVEDNASGTALVMELARIMSSHEYPATLVFMVTIGEEQGLYGAGAFAQYADQEDLPIMAVFNNDVIGGVICGQTSSAPSCPGANAIDSTQVRLFSSGSFNSPHKQLARYVKLQHHEELRPIGAAQGSWKGVPMLVSVMTAEDRTGRGGDHIPFRQRGFSAIRFTSANEHGNASNGAGYTDRQHTSGDVLGADTNGDGEVDSFYVDFHYLGRNALTNANAAVMAAYAPPPPSDVHIVGSYVASNGVSNPAFFEVSAWTPESEVRVMVRTALTEFDTITAELPSGPNHWIGGVPSANVYFISACAVRTMPDGQKLESLFSEEKMVLAGQIGLEEQETIEATSPFELLQNRPNPFDESTWIGVHVSDNQMPITGEIRITDLQGRLLNVIHINLVPGINEVLYDHGYGQVGTFNYSLFVEGRCSGTKQMIFAN